MSLNLIRFESQFQKSQNRFRKLILKLCFNKAALGSKPVLARVLNNKQTTKQANKTKQKPEPIDS